MLNLINRTKFAVIKTEIYFYGVLYKTVHRKGSGISGIER